MLEAVEVEQKSHSRRETFRILLFLILINSSIINANTAPWDDQIRPDFHRCPLANLQGERVLAHLTQCRSQVCGLRGQMQ